MKTLITIFVLNILALTCLAQHIVITGGVYDADTVRILVMNQAELIDSQTITSEVYSIKLGGKEYYDIRFESNRRVKHLHFYCYNIKAPTSIVQDVHFSNQTNLILWLWQGSRNKKNPKPERTIWGAHASWKDEF